MFPQELVLLGLLLSFVLAVVWRRIPYTLALLCIAVFLLGGALGMLRIEIAEWQAHPLSADEGNSIQLIGTVVREPDIRATNQHLYVRDDTSGELVLVTTDRFANVYYGDTVRARGELERPEAFETDLGRTFNYPGYLRARGVVHTLSFADVEVVDGGGGNAIVAFLLAWKHQFMDSFESFVPEPAAGLGEGLLLGVKRAIGEELSDAFRRTGVIHIVVLSGYNVMIVAEAIMRLLSFAFMPRIRFLLGVVAIGAFALTVGLSATVVRASIMAILVLIARATGRTTAILRTLTIAGFLMVLIDPYVLAFDPGFQLSFLATLGLVLLAPYIGQLLHMVPTKYQVREFIVATIATQIMVLPLLLYLMGQFSVVAVVVNVLVLGMVPFAMGLTFVTGVLGLLIPQFAVFVGVFTHLSLQYIIKIVSAFSALPFAAFAVPAFPFWIVVVSYTCLAYVLWRLSRRENGQYQLQTTTPSPRLTDWTIVPVREVPVHMKTSGEARSASPDAFPFR